MASFWLFIAESWKGLFDLSLFERHLGCFWGLTIIEKAALHIHTDVSVHVWVDLGFHFPGTSSQEYMIARLHGKCMVSVIKKQLKNFPEWLLHFIFSLVVLDESSFSVSL